MKEELEVKANSMGQNKIDRISMAGQLEPAYLSPYIVARVADKESLEV